MDIILYNHETAALPAGSATPAASGAPAAPAAPPPSA